MQKILDVDRERLWPQAKSTNKILLMRMNEAVLGIHDLLVEQLDEKLIVSRLADLACIALSLACKLNKAK
jgi:hypothetical protein